MTMPSTSRVHIVDDDEAIRDAIVFMLKAEGLHAEAWPSGEAFLKAWSARMRGCLLLDVRMAGMTGPECFSRLLELGNAMPVLFLTGHADVPMAVEALRGGAWHFLEKPFERHKLLQAVRDALAEDARRQREAAGRADVERRLATLSQREREVMDLILAGKLNKVIADDLNISMRTVEVHRSNIFEKMGVRSAVELAGLLGSR